MGRVTLKAMDERVQALHERLGELHNGEVKGTEQWCAYYREVAEAEDALAAAYRSALSALKPTAFSLTWRAFLAAELLHQRKAESARDRLAHHEQVLRGAAGSVGA